MGEQTKIVCVLLGGPRDGQLIDATPIGIATNLLVPHPSCSDLCAGCVAGVEHQPISSSQRIVRYQLHHFDSEGRAIYHAG